MAANINLQKLFPARREWEIVDNLFDSELVIRAMKAATAAFVETNPRRVGNAYDVASLAAKAAASEDDLRPLRWMGEETRGAVGAVIYAVAVAEGFEHEGSPYMANHVEEAVNRLAKEAPDLITEQKLREWATATA